MTDKTKDVTLTLEETGILCHLMMGQEDFRKSMLRGKTSNPVMARWFKLYVKLAAANDELMGKRP